MATSERIPKQGFSWSFHHTGWGARVLSINHDRCSFAEAWRPAMNMYECKRDCWVVVDLAGMCPKDIKIRVEGHRLTISGERRTLDIRERLRGMQLMEIDQGPFMRTLDMPAEVDASRVTASYRGGYLRIRAPKRQRRKQGRY